MRLTIPGTGAARPAVEPAAATAPADAHPNVEPIGATVHRTRTMGGWDVVEGPRAHAVGVACRAVIPGDPVPCALLTYKTPPLPRYEDHPFVLRVRLLCHACGQAGEGEGLIGGGRFDYFEIRCPHCRSDTGCRYIADMRAFTQDPTIFAELPENTILVHHISGGKLAVADIFSRSEDAVPPAIRRQPIPVPVVCPMCRGAASPRDGGLEDGLCVSCHKDSLAALRMVSRDPFTCDACNGSNPLEIGEIFKTPMISGSVFCKDCYPSAHGKSWRREREFVPPPEPLPCADSPHSRKSAPRKARAPAAPRTERSRPLRWPWYAGGAAAICLVVVVAAVAALPIRNTDKKNEAAKAEKNPLVKTEPAEQPKKQPVRHEGEWSGPSTGKMRITEIGIEKEEFPSEGHVKILHENLEGRLSVLWVRQQDRVVGMDNREEPYNTKAVIATIHWVDGFMGGEVIVPDGTLFEAGQKLTFARFQRRTDLEFLTSYDWMAAEGTGQDFLAVGTSIRFAKDGTMADWFRATDLGTFKIDPGQSPKHLDLTIRGETLRCAYEIVTGKRPEIRVCLPVAKGGPRPTKVEDPWKNSDLKGGGLRAEQVNYIVLSRVVKQ